MAETKARKTRKKTKKASEPPPLPSLDEAMGWIGARVEDWGGRNVGKVSGIHVDAHSGAPKWVIVKMARFAGEAAVPFEHVAHGAGRIWVAYEREALRSSPKLKANQTLNAKQELQLCEHYGIRIGVGRATDVADRQGDEVSAIPAD